MGKLDSKLSFSKLIGAWQDTIRPGQTLGAYRIISQVGQGGMATVYKAYQPSMDRNVAIKVLPRQLAETPEFVTRFQQEARIIARLEHPHIFRFSITVKATVSPISLCVISKQARSSRMEAAGFP